MDVRAAQKARDGVRQSPLAKDRDLIAAHLCSSLASGRAKFGMSKLPAGTA